MPDPQYPTPSTLIIVPRERPDLDRALRQAFAADSNVHLIADRRTRATGSAPDGENRHGDRRDRADRDAALGAGRWVVVPLAARRVDLADPGVQDILFFACGNHVVACETCQETYRFQWLRPEDRQRGACPRCSSDLRAAFAAHFATCVYWVSRATAAPLDSVA